MHLPRQPYNAAKLTAISDDFVIMGFFVGNDFLPRLQMFHMLPDGLRLMIDLYSGFVSKDQNFSLIRGGFLNLEGFRKFVKSLVVNEPTFLINQVTTQDPRRQPPEEKYVNQTILKNISTGIKERQLLLLPFKNAYYAKSQIKGTDDKAIMQMCSDYVRTLSWIHKYYTYGVPAWDWSYNYHYAPLMYDLDKFLSTITPYQWSTLQEFEKGSPLLPFEQLLAVLPPSSAHILPEEYRELFFKGILVESGYFPETIEKDYEGKLKEHEAHLLVPFIDPKVIMKAYESIPQKRTYTRNSFSTTVTFQYNHKHSVAFNSDFGKLPICHVEKLGRGCGHVLTLPEFPEKDYAFNLKRNVEKLFVVKDMNVTPYFGKSDVEFMKELKKYKKTQTRRSSKANEIIETLPPRLLHSNSRVLDFGAGNGEVLEDLSKATKLKKENALAFDLKEVPETDYYTVVGSLNKVKDASIDVVVLFEVLHHIPQKEHSSIAKQILSKVKKGGYIVLKEHAFIDNTFWLKYLDLIHEMWYVYQNEEPDVLYPIPNTFEHIQQLFGGKCVGVNFHEERNYQRIFRVCLKVGS